mmetsp:Transcript_23908/g.52852  ORF Transcript_23908/g.52852 Transcript_23908/m.52852 type:complete len:414 (-) Transcript_23908:223-1464(-)
MRQLVVSHILNNNNNNNNKDDTDKIEIDTRTLGGWCLIEAMEHCAVASDGVLAQLIEEHGPPSFYLEYLRDKHRLAQRKKTKQKQNTKRSHESIDNDGNNDESEFYGGSCYSFRSLCRIVSGQQLAGAAADTIWRRLVGVVVAAAGKAATTKATRSSTGDLERVAPQQERALFTPEAVLSLCRDEDNTSVSSTSTTEETLQKPSGLSRAKCGCIVAIARAFDDGSLSEDFLLCNNNNNNTKRTTTIEQGKNKNNTDEVRSRLLSIKGLGPWSVDMFMMFRCHHPNVLPIGDLGVRKGTGEFWGVCNNKNKVLCPKKDAGTIEKLNEPFAPYRSVSSYYMYKVADASKLAKTSKSTKTKTNTKTKMNTKPDTNTKTKTKTTETTKETNAPTTRHGNAPTATKTKPTTRKRKTAS